MKRQRSYDTIESVAKKPKTIPVVNDTPRIYVSFDIGIVHLAYVVIEIKDDDLLTDPLPIKILETECVDITDIKHNRVSKADCELHHTKQIYDRMTHFWQEYEPRWLEYGPIYKVFLERQPITGIGSVESLLFQRYRDRVVQVSPNAMHKYFGINKLDYDQRKDFTVDFAMPYLKHFPSFMNLERKHDCSDAFILLIYQMKMIQKEMIEKLEQEKRKAVVDEWFQETKGADMNAFFEQYKFKQI